MEALEALVTRRSTRNYKPDPVEQKKIDKILEAGRQAPSGGNNQTSHFFVIRNREVLDKLIVMTEKAFAAMEVTENTYASMKHSINASKKGEYVFCYNAPVLIVIANRKGYGCYGNGIDTSTFFVFEAPSCLKYRVSALFHFWENAKKRRTLTIRRCCRSLLTRGVFTI